VEGCENNFVQKDNFQEFLGKCRDFVEMESTSERGGGEGEDGVDFRENKKQKIDHDSLID
tara:strand:- start:326 stop:505 length:180 start_codon:yes stop_codon:yes gene_type:complete